MGHHSGRRSSVYNCMYDTMLCHRYNCTIRSFANLLKCQKAQLQLATHSFANLLTVDRLMRDWQHRNFHITAAMQKQKLQLHRLQVYVSNNWLAPMHINMAARQQA